MGRSELNLLMTSLDMHGFSVSTLPATKENIEALQAECEPTDWPAMSSIDQ